MRALKISKQITNRQADSTEKYLQEVSKIPLISIEEETYLAKRIKEGDTLALEKLVKANLRFVISVAKQYQHCGLSLGDLINEGNAGLIRAASKFDETRGFKFISYGVWWIRQSIMQAIAQQSKVVRLPLNKVGILNKINKTFSYLEQKYEREPTSEELSLLLNISAEEINQTLKSGSRSVSLDAPLEENSDNNLFNVIEAHSIPRPDSQLDENSLKEDMRRAMIYLSPKMALVLTYYYGLNGTHPLTLDEIGKTLKLTRERVRQLKNQAIYKLSKGPIKETFKSYLE